jgi:hypothetical protein
LPAKWHDTSAEKVEAYTTIHLALDHLQPVDLALDLAVLNDVSTAAHTASISFFKL